MSISKNQWGRIEAGLEDSLLSCFGSGCSALPLGSGVGEEGSLAEHGIQGLLHAGQALCH